LFPERRDMELKYGLPRQTKLIDAGLTSQFSPQITCGRRILRLGFLHFPLDMYRPRKLQMLSRVRELRCCCVSSTVKSPGYLVSW
jgi:hypothetical protein